MYHRNENAQYNNGLSLKTSVGLVVRGVLITGLFNHYFHSLRAFFQDRIQLRTINPHLPANPTGLTWLLQIAALG